MKSTETLEKHLTTTRLPFRLVAMVRSSLISGSSGSSGGSHVSVRPGSPLQLILLGIAAFLLVLLIIPGIVVIVALGIVLSPLALAISGGGIFSKTSTRLGKVCGFLLCISYVFCVVGWPYIVVFWLGPWSSTAVAVGNCISITVLIAFVYTFSWADNGKNLRDEDLHVHSKEIPVLESSRLWHLYLISILLDWYQYSAFAFSVPDLKLPPSVQDLLDAFFAFGRFSLPFLPREVALFIAFVAANAMMCTGPMFLMMLLASDLLRALITSHLHPAKGRFIQRFDGAFDRSRWMVAGERLKEQFPFTGGALFRVLDGADGEKWDKEISTDLIVFTSFLIGVVSANLRTMACVEEGDGQMTLAADRSIECWTPSHTLIALGGGMFLTAFLPAGLLVQLTLREEYGVSTHKWYTMLERPLKLLTVGVAIQSEALRWTRVRLIVTSASAVGIALASRALWSTNHAGLNKFRQLTWWSAAICSTSSWLHYEIEDPAGYVGVAYFTGAHFFLASTAFSDTEAEPLFTCAIPMQRLRRFTRLLILLVTVVFASTAGILPRLLAINTGGYLEEDLQISDFHTVTVDSCAIYVRTTKCSECSATPAGSPNLFQEGVAGGRLRVWGSGRLLEQTPKTTVIAGTDFEACELWLLVPTHAVFSVECNGACTVHANGLFDRSLVATSSH